MNSDGNGFAESTGLSGRSGGESVECVLLVVVPLIPCDVDEIDV